MMCLLCMYLCKKTICDVTRMKSYGITSTVLYTATLDFTSGKNWVNLWSNVLVFTEKLGPTWLQIRSHFSCLFLKMSNGQILTHNIARPTTNIAVFYCVAKTAVDTINSVLESPLFLF